MPLIQFKYKVEMRSGETLDVTAGQRDVLEFERQPFGTSLAAAMRDKLFLLMWFTAWHALRRERKISCTWDAFLDTECVEVVDQVPDEPVSTVDPTSPAPDAGD